MFRCLLYFADSERAVTFLFSFTLTLWLYHW